MGSSSEWEVIRRNVAAGLGSALYPVGTEFAVPHSALYSLTWRVVGHDHHTVSGAAHTMTLETKNVLSDANGNAVMFEFDAPEALYYASAGLTAGTYNFKVANDFNYTADNGKYFQFTLTQTLPPGGQIRTSAASGESLEGKTVKSYANASAITAIESAALSQGPGGTSLGTTDGTGGLHFFPRVVIGSNLYAHSPIRQYLNSEAAAGNVWQPQSRFDTPPSWHIDGTLDGFARGLPSDFKAAVSPASVPCRTNNMFEADSLDGTEYPLSSLYSVTDKFFVLSMMETTGEYESSALKDGSQLTYYAGISQAQRKKTDAAGSASTNYLRTPSGTNATSGKQIDATGAASNLRVSYAKSIAAACVIA